MSSKEEPSVAEYSCDQEGEIGISDEFEDKAG